MYYIYYFLTELKSYIIHVAYLCGRENNCVKKLTAMSSTGMGIGIFFAANALSSLAMIKPTMVTMLTTRVPMLVSPSNEQISRIVCGKRKYESHIKERKK